MNNLGNNIKERRILLGLTQQQLAERIGVSSRSVINKIEKGERNITQKMIERLATALFTTPGDLLQNCNVNTILYHTVATKYTNDKEDHLLTLFNQLNESQQSAIIAMMESMVK